MVHKRACLLLVGLAASALVGAQSPVLEARLARPRPLPPTLGTRIETTAPTRSLGTSVPTPLGLDRFPSPWRFHELGLFCKLDVELERWFALPVFFRLGDVAGVERLEGKGPYKQLP